MAKAAKKRVRPPVAKKAIPLVEVPEQVGIIPDFMLDMIKKDYVVVTAFRSLNDFNKSYNPGDDVSHLDEARLKDLIGLGLAKKNK